MNVSTKSATTGAPFPTAAKSQNYANDVELGFLYWTSQLNFAGFFSQKRSSKAVSHMNHALCAPFPGGRVA